MRGCAVIVTYYTRRQCITISHEEYMSESVCQRRAVVIGHVGRALVGYARYVMVAVIVTYYTRRQCITIS